MAAIVASPESGRVPLTVDFTGSGSIDADGSVASYAWDFGDGTTSTDADPQHTYTTVGAKAVSLTVTDDEGATDTATTTIAVDPNLSPTAAASADPTSGKLPLVVQFSSAGSADPDGSIASYAWTFGDGATSAAADPAHVYTTAGLFTAELTVTDDNGSTDTTTVDVQVNANQAPVAVAGSNISGGQAPLTVVFSSAGSTDADGGITGYSWDFGDGNCSASANPTYSYSAEGTYTATLTVTDAEGATDSASVVIDVDPIPNVPPTVVAGAGLTSQRVGLPISFSSAGTERHRRLHHLVPVGLRRRHHLDRHQPVQDLRAGGHLHADADRHGQLGCGRDRLDRHHHHRSEPGTDGGRRRHTHERHRAARGQLLLGRHRRRRRLDRVLQLGLR